MIELTVRLIGSLAVVVGLLLVTVRIGQRRFTTRTDAAVRVVHRQALSRGSTVTVVEVGSRVLVLGTTEQQINVLAELDPSELTGAARPADAVPELEAAGSASEPSAPSEPSTPSAPAAVALALVEDVADVREEPVAVPLPVAAPVAAAAVPVAVPVAVPAAVVPAAALAFEEVEAFDRAATPIDFETVPQTPETRELARRLSAQFSEPSGPLAGSILSAATWRQALTVARGRA